MEHKGLVARVAEDLERSIALGRYPRGTLPSERVMTRHYGVSRTTIRGALQGLAARGLIVQHPGRQSRTVALDQALTLESLKLALPAEGHPDPNRRRLLEGFLSLKREVAVELLSACCEHASHEDVDALEGACFALREEAHWQEDRRRWVRQEFELLRMAARAADRPGHVLLIQSLEKAFWGLSDRALPHLDAAAIEQWALFAFGALAERNAQALRQELPGLLQRVDACLLDPLAPVSREPSPPTPSPTPEPSPQSAQEPLSGATGANRYACHTTSDQPPPDGLPLQPVPSDSCPASSHVAPASALATPPPPFDVQETRALEAQPAPSLEESRPLQPRDVLRDPLQPSLMEPLNGGEHHGCSGTASERRTPISSSPRAARRPRGW